jgi:hypothetical protein
MAKFFSSLFAFINKFKHLFTFLSLLNTSRYKMTIFEKYKITTYDLWILSFIYRTPERRSL